MVSTLEGTLEHALFLARHLNKCSPQCAAVAMLLELGVPTKRIGFDYLKNAIVLFCEDPTQMITKGIYPAVGQLYTPEASPFQVEQAIRTAVNDAWENRDEVVWNYYFPADGHGNTKKPPNAEFISRMGRFLELWQGCCEEVSYGEK